MLFAAGGAGSGAGFAPSRSEILAVNRSDPDMPRSGADSEERSVLDLPVPPALETSAPPPVPVEAPAEAPPAPPAVDRPIVAPPAFAARPARPARPPRALTARPSGTKEGGVWAVVVGIDDYPGQDADLRAAAADARDVDAALAAYGVPAARRILMLDHNATAANIRASLEWLVRYASPDATVVFFYSGHVRQVSGDVDGDGEAVDEAIVAADGQHVLDGEVAEILRALEARSAWLGIAACYGSGFDDAIAPGRLLTAAAAEADLAYENSALGHSYLVEYMVRRAMLQGKAAGSVQEAFAWARGQIARDYPNRQPVVVDRSRGPVVLGVRGGTAPPQSAPPAPPAPAQPQPQPEEPQQPKPAPEPAPGPGETSPGACAQVLGVSVCSNSRATTVEVTPAWRPTV